MIKDSPARYGVVTRALHWLMAVLVVWQLLKLGDRIADGEHWVGQTLVPWHISIGVLLLVLFVPRLFWALSQRRERPQSEPALAVKAGHGLLYASLLLMPITGIMVMLGGGYGVKAFGIQLIARGEGLEWAASIGSLHSPLAWLLTALVIGHVGMALIHHFVKQDETLKRML